MADNIIPIGSITVNELILPGALGTYSVKEIFHVGRSEFQQIHVVDLECFGRTLLLDDKVQSSSTDEFIYHESLVYPSLLSHPNPKKVLILGGGEGGTARETLRFKSVERCVMVDIDKVVTETCKEYLPSYHKGAWDNSRFELVIDDAKAYLENSEEKWDVIISDLCDPVPGGPCYMLYTVEFYEMLKTKLAPEGIFVTQSGPCGMFNIHEVHIPVKNTLAKVFNNSTSYHSHCPSFLDHYGFTMASDSVEVQNYLLNANVEKLIEERVDATHEIDAKPTDVGNSVVRHFDEETLKASFVIPKWMKKICEQKSDVIITNEKPTFLS